MSWNHRLLAKEYKGDVYYQIHEVYYDNKGNPNSYTANPITIGSDYIEGIKWQLEEITKCLEKPILSLNNFPKEYKQK